MSHPDPDLRMLGVARLVFGGLVLFRTTPLLGLLHVRYDAGTSPLLGWPTHSWHVATFGVALPPAWVAAFCVGRTVAVVLFTLGAWTTAAGVAASVLGYVVLSQNVMGYVNTLHLLMAGMLCLAVGGAGARFALRPEPAIDPRSGLWLVRALAVSVYAWSGTAKLNGSWLGGAALLQLHDSGIVGGALSAHLLATPWGRVLTACGVAAAELALGPLLLWRRTRPAAVTAALLFHAVLEAVLHPDFFGFAMAALLLSFVEPSHPPATDTAPATPPLAQARR